jgi:hypothetical protein
VLLELGRQEEAFAVVNDAINRYTPFVQSWPDVYGAELGRTYLVLADILDRLGHNDEAANLRRQLRS